MRYDVKGDFTCDAFTRERAPNYFPLHSVCVTNHSFQPFEWDTIHSWRRRRPVECFLAFLHSTHFTQLILLHSLLSSLTLILSLPCADEKGDYYQQQPPQQEQRHQAPPHPQRNELNYGLQELRYKVAAAAAARRRWRGITLNNNKTIKWIETTFMWILFKFDCSLPFSKCTVFFYTWHLLLSFVRIDNLLNKQVHHILFTLFSLLHSIHHWRRQQPSPPLLLSMSDTRATHQRWLFHSIWRKSKSFKC